MVGTALAVIIPEGIHELYENYEHECKYVRYLMIFSVATICDFFDKNIYYSTDKVPLFLGCILNFLQLLMMVVYFMKTLI